MATVLVQVLSGVFDPPPDTLFVPWTYLGLVVAAAAVCTAGAVAFMQRLAGRRDPLALRQG